MQGRASGVKAHLDRRENLVEHPVVEQLQVGRHGAIACPHLLRHAVDGCQHLLRRRWVQSACGRVLKPVHDPDCSPPQLSCTVTWGLRRKLPQLHG